MFFCIVGIVLFPVAGRLEEQERMLQQQIVMETEWLKARVMQEGKLLREDYERYQQFFSMLGERYAYDIWIARPLVYGQADENKGEIWEKGEGEQSYSFTPQYGAYEMLYRAQIEHNLEENGEICAGKKIFLNIFVEKCNVLKKNLVIYYRDILLHKAFYYTTGGEIQGG